MAGEAIDDVVSGDGYAVGTLDEARLLTYFWRTGHARAALWPIVGSRVAQPLTPVPSAQMT